MYSTNIKDSRYFIDCGAVANKLDILKQIIMIANSYDKKIYFCKDEKDYKQNFQLNVKR